MKKFLVIFLVFSLWAFPALAANQFATVYHPITGKRKVVEVGSPNAFKGGFVLETKVGGRTSSNSFSFGGSWESYNSATTTNPNLVATSTNSALGDAKLLTATTTIELSLPDSDNIFLNGFIIASGTPATNLHLIYKYSYDEIASTTGWYQEYDAATISGGIRTWTPTEEKLSFIGGVASSSVYWMINVPTHRAKKLRVYYSQSGAATTDIPFVYIDVWHK